MPSILAKPFLISFCLIMVLTSCAPKLERQAARMAKKGKIVETTLQTKVRFDTIRSLMLVPVVHNGEPKKFIFDTGAMVTAVKKDNIGDKTLSVGGASKRRIDVGFENVRSIKIGETDFVGTFAATNPLDGLGDVIPNFGGFIGQPIISRANWLIDYPKKELTLSTQHLVDDSYHSLKIDREDGAPYTTLTVNGVSYKCIIDLGASCFISIPKGTPLAEYVLDTYAFKDTERKVWTIGGFQMDTERVSMLPELNLGGLDFQNIEMNVKVTSQLRVGMKFFMDYLLYIDNINGDYKIKKTK